MQCAALTRNADHRKYGMGCDHAGQMRGQSRSGNDHAITVCLGGRCDLRRQFRCSMCRAHSCIERNIELLQELETPLHNRKIRVTPHYY